MAPRKPAPPSASRRRSPIAIPHVEELGIDLIEAEGDHAVLSLPWQEWLVGNPDSGVLHGGVITTLVDTACGVAVLISLERPVPIMTLDLRIDYLRPATPHRDLMARATCYKVTRHIAFARAEAYHADSDEPVANSVGTFILNVGAPVEGTT